MSSSSTTPIELLRTLTIHSKMNFPDTDIKSRALQVRDILSSFDRDILPSEFRPHIYAQLDRPIGARAPVNQWTIQEDLPGTLLQWGAYREDVYGILTSLQSASTLARCFYEKIGRRFGRLFDEYDHLLEGHQDSIRLEIQRIADDFRNVVAAVEEDRSYRQLGQESIARKLLEALAGICRRHADLVPRSQQPASHRRDTRSSASSMEDPYNLYEALIKRPSQEDVAAPTDFMVGVLEMFEKDIWQNLEQDHSKLLSTLDELDAPAPYKHRVQQLPTGHQDTSAAINRPALSPTQGSFTGPASTPRPHGTSSVSSNTRAQTQTQTPALTPTQSRSQASAQAQTSSGSTSTTGAKRSAESEGSTSRRGKKKTTR